MSGKAFFLCGIVAVENIAPRRRQRLVYEERGRHLGVGAGAHLDAAAATRLSPQQQVLQLLTLDELERLPGLRLVPASAEDTVPWKVGHDYYLPC